MNVLEGLRLGSHFRPHWYTLISKNGWGSNSIGRGQKVDTGIPAKRWQIQQNFYIERHTDEWTNARRGGPVQILRIHTNQRWNISERSEDQTGASTRSHDKAVGAVEKHLRPETITGKQLVQDCYAMAWVGVEPTTFVLQGIHLSTEQRQDFRVGTISSFIGSIFKPYNVIQFSVLLSIICEKRV